MENGQQKKVAREANKYKITKYGNAGDILTEVKEVKHLPQNCKGKFEGNLWRVVRAVSDFLWLSRCRFRTRVGEQPR